MGGLGSGGHNRRSAESHALTGTYRPSRHGPKPAPSVEAKAPPMPGWLSAAAKREWRRIVPELERRGVICQLDRVALEMYCESYADVQELAGILAREGLTYTTARGVVKARPEVAMERRAMLQMLAAARELGMTPASRSRLPEPALPPAGNPFLELMRPPAPREPAG